MVFRVLVVSIREEYLGYVFDVVLVLVRVGAQVQALGLMLLFDLFLLL